MPTANWANLFTIDPSCIVDLTIRAPRDTNNVAYPIRHTRLERGVVT
jgi:hypothetical protein